MAPGDRGCLSLFGDKPESHRLFAEHLTAEYRVPIEGRDRAVEEWKLRPERADNHRFDCLVGTAVEGSMLGCTVDRQTRPVKAKRRRKKTRVRYF